LRTGWFITFEGGEGVGKSTQIGLLATRLRGFAREVVITREPGGTPLAEKLRAIILSGGAREFGPLGEALLFSAARIDHIDRLIRPALSRGATVLCDRFVDSTRAYQGAKGGVDPSLLAAMQKVTLAGLAPDLTFILDLDPQIGLERAQRRRGVGEPDRFEAEDIAFHRHLRENFLEIAREAPERCRVIDASRSVDEIAQSIWTAVKDKFLAETPGEKLWA